MKIPPQCERTEPIRIQYSVAIGLCAQKLKRRPTAEDLAKWSAKETTLFPEALTLEQAQYLLDHPTELFDTVKS